MKNSSLLDGFSMFFTSLVQGFRDDLSHPIGFVQIGAIGVTYLIAWLLAKKIHQYLEKDIEKVKAHMRFILSPAHFAIMLKYIFWLLLVWFCQVLFKEFTIPARPFAHDPQPYPCLAGHSLCIFLHKEYFLVPLCLRDLPDCYIFADIQIVGTDRSPA